MILPKIRSDMWIYSDTFTLMMKRKHQVTSSDINLIEPHGKSKGKGKAIPLQAWTGPEGCRRLRLPDF
jgi:hypothetical protein